jgi:hypothetical protein
LVSHNRPVYYLHELAGVVRMNKQKEAVLYRKLHDEVRVRVAMRGRAEELVKHVMSTPPKRRRGYFIRDGVLDYDLEEIGRLVTEFNMSDPWMNSRSALKP